MRATPRAALTCKLLFIAVCAAVALGGKHPPLVAEETSAREFQQAVENAVANARQAERSETLNKRMDQMDARMSKQWDAVNANTNAISGFQGETRALLGLLGLLQGAGFVFQVRKKRQES